MIPDNHSIFVQQWLLCYKVRNLEARDHRKISQWCLAIDWTKHATFFRSKEQASVAPESHSVSNLSWLIFPLHFGSFEASQNVHILFSEKVKGSGNAVKKAMALQQCRASFETWDKPNVQLSRLLWNLIRDVTLKDVYLAVWSLPTLLTEVC